MARTVLDNSEIQVSKEQGLEFRPSQCFTSALGVTKTGVVMALYLQAKPHNGAGASKPMHHPFPLVYSYR